MADAHRAGNVGQQHAQRYRARLGGDRVDVLAVGDEGVRVSATGLEQRLLQPQPQHLGDAPRLHVLAAHLVAIGGLALQHQDAHAGRCQCGGDRRPGDAPTDHDHVELFHDEPSLLRRPGPPQAATVLQQVLVEDGPTAVNSRAPSLHGSPIGLPRHWMNEECGGASG